MRILSHKQNKLKFPFCLQR